MKRQFDCLDFIHWTMGKRFDFGRYKVPNDAVFLRLDLETLIDEYQL